MSEKKYVIPGVPEASLNRIKEEDQKDFLNLMGRLYLRSSEEVVIEEIFNKALRIFIREKLLKDGVLETIVKYSYDNDINPFDENGNINNRFIKHVLEHSKCDDELYKYLVSSNTH